MSTRCNVVIKTADKAVQLYRHGDGFPEYTGENLKTLTSQYMKEVSATERTVDGLVKFITEHDEDDAYEVEGSVGLHFDIEYLYVIDLDANTLTCYLMYLFGEERVKTSMELVNGEGVGIEIKSAYSERSFPLEELVYVFNLKYSANLKFTLDYETA